MKIENSKLYMIKYDTKEIGFIKNSAEIKKENPALNEIIKNNKQTQESSEDSLKRLMQVKNRIFIFKGLDDSEVINLVSDVKILKFQKDSIIIKQGVVSKDMYFVLLGECSIFVNFIKVGVIGTSNIVGEVAAMFETPRNATVIANKDNTIVLSFKINTQLHKKLSFEFTVLYRNLAYGLSKKLENVNNLVVEKSKNY